MIFKNAELYNAAEIVNNDDGSISWKRVPAAVCSEMESAHGRRMVDSATGVELRFVLKGEQAVIRNLFPRISFTFWSFPRVQRRHSGQLG